MTEVNDHADTTKWPLLQRLFAMKLRGELAALPDRLVQDAGESMRRIAVYFAEAAADHAANAKLNPNSN